MCTNLEVVTLDDVLCGTSNLQKVILVHLSPLLKRKTNFCALIKLQTGVVTYYGFYDGVLDHLRINTETFHLWQPEQKYGQGLFHVNRRFLKRPASPVFAASFFGTGGLWHKMGKFSVNASTFGVAMEFRTLHKNGALLEVLNGTNIPALDVFLQDGHLKTVLRNVLSKEIILTTQR